MARADRRIVSLLPFLTALMTTHLGEEGEHTAVALLLADVAVALLLLVALAFIVAPLIAAGRARRARDASA